jgi:hypothetical protein
MSVRRINHSHTMRGHLESKRKKLKQSPLVRAQAKFGLSDEY